MKDECVICKAPLEYLEQDVPMECVICHKKENSILSLFKTFRRRIFTFSWDATCSAR